MLKEEQEGQRGRERNEVGGRRREVGEGGREAKDWMYQDILKVMGGKKNKK